MSRRQVVTILSTNYAGSHYLSLLLGSHHLARHVGELKYLRRTHRQRSCPMCEDLNSCPLLKGITPENIDRCYQTIFQNFDDVGERVHTLVDTSKKIKWAEKFVGRKDYEYLYIHLLRDPRALVRRWSNSFKSWKQILHTRWNTFKRSKPLNLKVLTSSWTEVLLQKWLNENRQIDEFCKHNNLQVLNITYRDLCQEVLESSLNLTRFLGLPFDGKMLEYWGVKHHGTAKPAYKFGTENKSQAFQDLRWQHDLDPRTIDKINAHEQLHEYLSSKNLILLNDGLTILNKPQVHKQAA